MKYAQYNGNRIEPQKGLKGAVCPVCGSPVIPKCGEIKMHHWAHESKENCDHWWESETEWHRKWKDCFPSEWQEYIMHDETMDKNHVADVRSEHGLIVEFQHSSIKEEERISREKFYKNMVWVIDAKENYNNFKNALRCKALKKIDPRKGYFYTDTYDVRNCFSEKWLNSSVPVIFDFGINDVTQDEYYEQARWLWCVFPEKYKTSSSIQYLCGLCMKKETFIKRISKNKEFFQNIVLEELKEEGRKFEEQAKAAEAKWKQEEHKRIKTQCAEEKPWREAIQKLRDSLNKGDLKPIRLFVRGQEITDYKNAQIYNHSKCMVLGIKSYKKTWNEIHYIQHDALILIESKQGIIPAIVAVPKWVINFLYQYFSHFNYRIVNIEVFDFGDKYKVDFDAKNSKRIFTTKATKESLEFIDKTFSKCLDE